MSTVYVVQEPFRRVTERDVENKKYPAGMLGEFVPVFDLSPASEYGRFVHLTKSVVRGAMAYPRMTSDISMRLREFSDSDYILPTGDPILTGIALHIALRNNQGRAKVLRWDHNLSKYLDIQLEVNT